MSILDFIQEIFSKKTAPITENKYYQLRTSPFFLNPQSQAHYLTYGWTLVEDVIEQNEIDSFMDTFAEISQLE
jgi:hypothetical protein